MKNVLTYSISKVIFIALFVYTSGEFYVNLLKMDAFDRALMDGEFDRAMREGRMIEFNIEFPLLPAILTILTGIILIVVYLQKNRNSPKKLNWEEFEEKDEREVLITSKATKSAYTTIVYTVFLAIAFLVFTTSWLQTFPAIPIYLLGVISIISSIVYAAVWCIEYRK